MVILSPLPQTPLFEIESKVSQCNFLSSRCFYRFLNGNVVLPKTHYFNAASALRDTWRGIVAGLIFFFIPNPALQDTLRCILMETVFPLKLITLTQLPLFKILGEVSSRGLFFIFIPNLALRDFTRVCFITNLHPNNHFRDSFTSYTLLHSLTRRQPSAELFERYFYSYRSVRDSFTFMQLV